MNKLTLSNITKIFTDNDNQSVIFKNINATFNQGTSYAITGISGSGKSTLLSLLAGLDQPTSGSVLYNDVPVTTIIKQNPRAFFHQTIGIIFQMPFLLKELTVLENVIIKGLVAGQTLEACKEHGLALLKSVNLVDKAYAMPAQLSGGEQQRASIARALFSKPQFLLADEPTAHLDTQNRAMILDVLHHYLKHENLGLVISTHDPFIAEHMQVHREIRQSTLHEVRSSQ